ncbi:MAG: PD-(D/E)XK nuclease family transposase [Candidatus Poribacteria bacterium]|nr:PD-(D/E)XK nuclease family transposase [Candidatus Poribacteria bacterium]
MAQVVPLRYDTAFKKAFGQPEIFCQFAEDVLGIKFHTDEVHRGYKFLEPIGQVDIEYDLFAEDPESRIVVEIQHVKEGHFYDRFLYYHLINLVEQVKNSKAYQFDRTVYTIVVLTSPYSENEIDFSVAITDFNPVNEFNRKVNVYPHQLVFVVPRMVNDKTPSGIKVWLELVLDSLDGEIDESHYNSPIFERVIDAVKLDNISPAERRVLKDEESWEDTLIDEHNRGRQKEKEAITRSLIREGISTEVITRTTGLTAAEIEKLRQS